MGTCFCEAPSADGHPAHWRARSAVAVRMLVGAVLLTAAGLKAHQLATEPVPEQNLPTYRWSLATAVECELLLGLLLVSGLFGRLTWAVAVVTFTFFSGVTLWKALSVEVSCGCFGVVKVNPWITLSLDLTLLALLLVFRPGLRRGQILCPVDCPVDVGRSVLADVLWMTAVPLTCGERGDAAFRDAGGSMSSRRDSRPPGLWHLHIVGRGRWRAS